MVVERSERVDLDYLEFDDDKFERVYCIYQLNSLSDETEDIMSRIAADNRACFALT